MELQPEAFTGVLKPSVAMNQGLCIGIFLQGEIKGCKYEMVVVAPSYGIGNDIIGFQVKNSAEVEFLPIAIGHFCNICEPFFVCVFCTKVSGQYVFYGLFFCMVLVSWFLAANDCL